jgi:hypothetical protein
VRFSAPRTGGPDGLTRTTLQIDGTMSPPSVAQVLEALQRVPGVLLAEVNPQNARAVVAHDAAVPAASPLHCRCSTHGCGALQPSRWRSS